MNVDPHPALMVVGATVVVDILMVLTDTGPNLLAITALGLVLSALVAYVVDTGPIVARPRPATTTASAPEQRSDLRITTLRQALKYGNTSSDHYLSARVHHTLVAVIDDELRSVHGIDRATDPAGALAILGPELNRFVEEPRTAAWTPRRLAHIVTLIEQI